MLPKEQFTICRGDIPRQFTFRKLATALLHLRLGLQQLAPRAIHRREINLLRERQCIVGTAARRRILRK